MAGRKPALQVVREGNTDKSKVRHEVKLPPKVPNEPDWLEVLPDGADAASSERIRATAARLWNLWVSILNPQGLIAEVDGMVLQDAAVCAASLEEYERQVKREGAIVKGYDGHQVKHPMFPAIHAYRTNLKSYIPMLGLAPGTRLQALKGPDDDSDFD